VPLVSYWNLWKMVDYGTIVHNRGQILDASPSEEAP
jgi:hypothetical protein